MSLIENIRNCIPYEDYSITYYKNILDKLSESAFELLNYIHLFDINSDEFNDLITTLKVLNKNKFIKINDEQNKSIISSSIYQNCKSDILKKISKLKEDKRVETENLIRKILNNNEILSDELINEIFNYLKKYRLPESYIKDISFSLLDYNSRTYENMIKITDDELKDLFSKFGYSYDLVRNKNILLKSGNIVNIENNFSKIRKYNINFDEKIKAHILLLTSNVGIINNIYTLSQVYNFDINDLLKNIPSIFSNDYENFIKNIKLIEELGYNLSSIINNNYSILIVPNDRIKKNVDLLLEYGFPKNLSDMNFKLSSLKSVNISLTLDRFIELDELKYALENSSRFLMDSNSYMFYRLYFAKKYDRINFKRLYDGKEVLAGFITNKANTKLDSIMDMESTKNYVFDEKTDFEIRKLIENNFGVKYDIVDDNLIEKIENKYMVNYTEYKFDGVIVSRHKARRIYSILISNCNYDKELLLLYALTYNSILDHNEFNLIKNSIREREK